MTGPGLSAQPSSNDTSMGHGATFDLDGKMEAYPNAYFSGVSLAPLPTADVKVVNGTVYVHGA